MVFADLFFLYFFLPLCLICYFFGEKLITQAILITGYIVFVFMTGSFGLGIVAMLGAAFNWAMGFLSDKSTGTKTEKMLLAVTAIVDVPLLIGSCFGGVLGLLNIAFFTACYFAGRKLITKNVVLIIFSLVFYAWGEPLWVLLLLFSAVLNWGMGLLVGKFREAKAGKLALAGAIVVDVLLLMIFKYSGFLVENFNGLFHTELPIPQITLPIGISFFTFQAISYVIDCYWETVTPQKSFPKFLLYLSLFPQLIAGPIVRYSVVEKEIVNRKSTINDISEGAMRFVVGLAKKVIIANNLYAVVTQFFGDVNSDQYIDISSLSFLGTWFVIICYSLYVYFDFSGYSDMAIGLGRMLGFHFNENFNYPFICKSISEFWQRWHISLSTFFRDYLFYVPIFGKPRKYFNLFLVWFCTGFWHGAAWNFIFWGLYYGLFLLLEIKLGKKRMKKWPTWVCHIYTKLVIVIGFGIFCFSDLSQLGNFFLNISGISMMTNHNAFADQVTWSAFLKYLFLLITAIAVSMPILPKLKKFFFEWGNNVVYTTGKIAGAVGCAFLLIMSSILLVDTTNNPFLYFRF